MKLTLIYISIIIILIFKDEILERIINFNIKNDVPNKIKFENIFKFMNNFNFKNINLKNINLNNLNFRSFNFNNNNFKNINLNNLNFQSFNFNNNNFKILLILFLFLITNRKNFNLIIVISFIILITFYSKINFFLNQLLNIYNNKFLINKFILV